MSLGVLAVVGFCAWMVYLVGVAFFTMLIDLIPVRNLGKRKVRKPDSNTVSKP